VIHRYRGPDTNLRTQFERIIRLAGVEAWPRLFHNLRASRQTELSNEYPPHVVADWLGNTVAVADTHYLMTTDEHYQRAVGGCEGGADVVQKRVPQTDARKRTAAQAAPQDKKRKGLASASPCDTPSCENVKAPRERPSS
jgi:hypothetical protein